MAVTNMSNPHWPQDIGTYCITPVSKELHSLVARSKQIPLCLFYPTTRTPQLALSHTYVPSVALAVPPLGAGGSGRPWVAHLLRSLYVLALSALRSWCTRGFSKTLPSPLSLPSPPIYLLKKPKPWLFRVLSLLKTKSTHKFKLFPPPFLCIEAAGQQR